MRIRLLGTAAGGGVPQWNCNCSICRETRAGTGRVRRRAQSCVAISADDQHWFLLNASPDLRVQIESTPALQPPRGKTRGSPIEAVLLTNADLDHTLGLLLLREGERLPVHAPASVQHSLTAGISMAGTLDSFCGLDWITPPESRSPLRHRDGSGSGLGYQAIPLSGQPPRFMKKGPATSRANAIGYRITDEKSGGRLLFLPDVATLDESLTKLLSDCDVLLFDGTFWSEREMEEQGAGMLTASSMGHAPISGPGGSLKILTQLELKNKTYIHINNTNPILIEDSRERAAVTEAGCVVGEDGTEVTI